MIETARGSFPGHGFTLEGPPDGHGPFLRFSWTLAPQVARRWRGASMCCGWMPKAASRR
ncbi:hypothetical protein ACFQU7_03960 [Pseudoroseomonas wenyumeiae]